jgi:peptidoglycan/LPS O-acetylase OafA/YrhL
MTTTRTDLAPGQAVPLSGYLPTLDGWRAVAVLLVVAAHNIHSETLLWWQKLPLGSLGVSIFFGLSGLLICTRLIEEHRQRGRISLRGFYVRRAFRIFPPAWAFLAALAVLTAAGVLAVHWSEFVGSLGFCRNYYPGDTVRWYTGHFWSLAVEEHFYLFFPALLVCCGPRRALWISATLALAVAAWRGVDTRQHLFERLWPGAGGTYRTDLRLDGLLGGCCAALLLDRYPTLFRRLLAPPVVVLLVVGVLATMHPRVPFPHFWCSLLIPWFLAGTVLWPASALSRVLEWQPLRWVGRLSYSLYLWQQLWFVGAGNHLAPALRPFQSWPWNFAALFGCAAASYYLLERPMIRLGHRLARPVSPGREDTVPARSEGSKVESDPVVGITEARKFVQA